MARLSQYSIARKLNIHTTLKIVYVHASRRKPLHSEPTKLGINCDICLLFARNVAAFLYSKLAVENLKGGDLVLLAELKSRNEKKGVLQM